MLHVAALGIILCAPIGLQVGWVLLVFVLWWPTMFLYQSAAVCTGRVRFDEKVIDDQFGDQFGDHLTTI